ncbi:MAG: OmpA family protein, partial [Acidimicrobiia bacterium]|nr:OmpA family protein [Acidimicrobiia bacterium]
VEIVGHTDDLGPEDENLILSQDRADAVKARLVELGIEETRLTARGEGEQSPLIDEDTPEARARNRRIEFRLISG